MDATLLAFLQAREGSEREDLREKLILEEAAPLVRQTIRYRLRFYLSERGANPSNPDAEDLYHDILARLVKALARLEGGPDLSAIRDFGQYAARVAANACHDYLRGKYPQRARLKDRVRDLLERRREFALWKGPDEELLCGLAGWRHEPWAPGDRERRQRVEREQDHFPRERLAKGGAPAPPLPLLLREIFEWAGGPIELECAVGLAALALDLRERQYESLDADPESLRLSSTRETARIETVMEERVALHRLWAILRTLPARQRETFFYSFTTSKGEDLLTLLFQGGVATPSQIAQALGVPLNRLMAIWKVMPLRNADLAVVLGVERQQVNKWRFQAIKMIEKRLHGPKR